MDMIKFECCSDCDDYHLCDSKFYDRTKGYYAPGKECPLEDYPEINYKKFYDKEMSETTEEIIDEWCKQSYWNGWGIGVVCGAVILFMYEMVIVFMI